jgi:hypothetical protein
VVPPSFWSSCRQLLIHQGLCEIMIKLEPLGCMSDPCVDSPCVYMVLRVEGFYCFELLSCKPDSSINFVAAILIGET